MLSYLDHLSPPDWTFGVVWQVLYVMMGISAFLIWKCGLRRRQVGWLWVFSIPATDFERVMTLIFFWIGI